jgi:Rrf2 family transcriptional regulator, cysteine metabolism repressor
MKLSTKVRYGVRAMIDLANHTGSGPVLVQQIAQRQQLSKKYLENLLVVLKGASLVRSVRGAKGGYTLARGADEMTLLDIVEALDGPIALVDCTGKPEECTRWNICATRDLWSKVSDQIIEILKSKTLAQLAEEEVLKAKHSPEMYFI